MGRWDRSGFLLINRYKNFDTNLAYNIYNNGYIDQRPDLLQKILPSITLSPYTYVTGGTGTFADPYTLDI